MLETYVHHRISEIKKKYNTSEAVWHYLPSNDNPTDLLTRGISASNFLKSGLWVKEQIWLGNPIAWPEFNFEEDSSNFLVCGKGLA